MSYNILIICTGRSPKPAHYSYVVRICTDESDTDIGVYISTVTLVSLATSTWFNTTPY